MKIIQRYRSIYHLSELSRSCYDFLEHSEISLQTEEGVLESCWFVLLKEEVTDPCEPIPDKKCKHNSTDVKGEDDSPDKLQKCKHSSNKMQSPVGPVTMLGQIERIELLKTFILLLIHKS